MGWVGFGYRSDGMVWVGFENMDPCSCLLRIFQNDELTILPVTSACSKIQISRYLDLGTDKYRGFLLHVVVMELQKVLNIVKYRKLQTADDFCDHMYVQQNFKEVLRKIKKLATG